MKITHSVNELVFFAECAFKSFACIQITHSYRDANRQSRRLCLAVVFCQYQ